MKKQIFLGVDGGNTKTDFFLFDEFGEKLGYLRTGTSSHETLPGGYEQTKKVLEERINKICLDSGITISDIDSTVLGLAGADTKEQHIRLKEIASQILPGKTMVCNDSVLGILAAAPECVGVCCINGTSTNVCGIQTDGTMLQVGGFGQISSDFGGGAYLAREVLRCVYSARYRDTELTELTTHVLKYLGLNETDDLLEAFHPNKLNYDKKMELFLNQTLFRCAVNGDTVSKNIIYYMTDTLAQSTIGCIKGLNFQKEVTVVLAGSIWVKSDFPEMRDRFFEKVRQAVFCECEFIILEQAPAMGAILGAYKNLNHCAPPENFRKKIAKNTKIVSC